MVLICIRCDSYFLITLIYQKIFLETVYNMHLSIIFYCFWGVKGGLISPHLVNNRKQIQRVINFEPRTSEP